MRKICVYCVAPVLVAMWVMPAGAFTPRNPDSKAFKTCVSECRAGRGSHAMTAAYLQQSCEEVCDLAVDDELRDLTVVPKNAVTGERIIATVSLYMKSGAGGQLATQGLIHRLWGDGTFNDLKEGEYMLEAELPGFFLPQSIPVTIRPTENKDYSLEISMMPADQASPPKIVAMEPVGEVLRQPGAATAMQVRVEDVENDIEVYAVVPEGGKIRLGGTDGVADSPFLARRVEARFLEDPKVLNFVWQAPENIDYVKLRSVSALADEWLSVAGDQSTIELADSPVPWPLLLRYGVRLRDGADDSSSNGQPVPMRLDTARVIDGAIDLEVGLADAAINMADPAAIGRAILGRAQQGAAVATTDSLNTPAPLADADASAQSSARYLQIMAAVRDKTGNTDMRTLTIEVE